MIAGGGAAGSFYNGGAASEDSVHFTGHHLALYAAEVGHCHVEFRCTSCTDEAKEVNLGTRVQHLRANHAAAQTEWVVKVMTDVCAPYGGFSWSRVRDRLEAKQELVVSALMQIQVQGFLTQPIQLRNVAKDQVGRVQKLSWWTAAPMTGGPSRLCNVPWEELASGAIKIGQREVVKLQETGVVVDLGRTMQKMSLQGAYLYDSFFAVMNEIGFTPHYLTDGAGNHIGEQLRAARSGAKARDRASKKRARADVDDSTSDNDHGNFFKPRTLVTLVFSHKHSGAKGWTVLRAIRDEQGGGDFIAEMSDGEYRRYQAALVLDTI